MTVVLTHGALQPMLFGKLKLTVTIALAFGLVGSAALFGERPTLARDKGAGPSGKTKAKSVKEEAPTVAVREILDRLGITVVGKLHETRAYGGLEADKNTTLKEALGQVARHWDGVTFEFDELAFNAEGAPNVGAATIVENAGIEGGILKLATVLKRLLQRVPAKSGATFLIRGDLIEITTNAAVRHELGLPRDRPVPPLFSQTLVKRPLSEALDVVAELTGTNVVLDSRLADKAKDVRVTARLANVPVETAVRLLADMGGLRVVRQANVLYVTTPENAARLLAENERKAR